ncbi:hypothetical protein PV326_007286, partial [Microctonus aethiopoides]
MERRKASIQNTLRSLKQPTKLDEIIEAIPKPKGAVPSFGLPRWKVMPLGSKLPLVPAPNGAYYFSRKKIGQELFTDTRKNPQFNLNDPYNYDTDYSYDPLHDGHLAHYFAKKNIMKRMMQRKFITKNLDVICSIKQYNMYRKYLKELHNDSIKKQLQREAEIRDDRRVLEMAEKEAQKDIIKIKTREKKNAARNKISRDLIRKKKKKHKEREKKAAQAKERLKIIEINKKENINQIVLEAKLRAENVKRKRAMIKEKDRKKIIDVLLKIAKRERNRKKMRKKRKFQEAESKRKINEEKWELKCRFQKNQLRNEQLALEYIKQQRNNFINNYKNKVDKERERIE